MCSHVFCNSSLLLLSGLKRVLTGWTEREDRAETERGRESVPQGALTTLRTVVCVDRVPLSFQEIRFYSSDQSHSFFSSEIMHTNTHLHARRYIQTDKHTSIVPPLIIPQSADSRVI